LIVILNDGLNKIEEVAFFHCKSLQHIIIPNTVKTKDMGHSNIAQGW
jgi:hypothetical protein